MTDPTNRWRAAALAVATLLPLHAARAEPTVPELLQRLEEQEQKILVLERKLEIKDEADKSAAASNAAVKASPKGFSLQSADGQSQVKLRGVLHFDGRNFNDDVTPTRRYLGLRRARPIIEGHGRWDVHLLHPPDFAGGKTVARTPS
jgi:phosphate-selective porin OprO/OprP